MNVIYENRRIRFESTNDLNYILKQLPIEFNHRKSTLPSSTKVHVSIEVDGIYNKELDPSVDLTSKDEMTAALQEILNLSSDEMTVTGFRPMEHSYSVHLKIELDYPSLGECTSDEILADAKARMKAVQDLGLNLREPQPQD